MSPSPSSLEQDWRNPPTPGEHINVEINAERLTGSVNITGEKGVPGMKGGKRQHLGKRRLAAGVWPGKAGDSSGGRKQSVVELASSTGKCPFPYLLVMDHNPIPLPYLLMTGSSTTFHLWDITKRSPKNPTSSGPAAAHQPRSQALGRSMASWTSEVENKPNRMESTKHNPAQP